jgi:hypothetical protein
VLVGEPISREAKILVDTLLLVFKIRSSDVLGEHDIVIFKVCYCRT